MKPKQCFLRPIVIIALLIVATIVLLPPREVRTEEPDDADDQVTQLTARVAKLEKQLATMTGQIRVDRDYRLVIYPKSKSRAEAVAFMNSREPGRGDRKTTIYLQAGVQLDGGFCVYEPPPDWKVIDVLRVAVDYSEPGSQFPDPFFVQEQANDVRIKNVPSRSTGFLVAVPHVLIQER